jgi:hypothetical protein
MSTELEIQNFISQVTRRIITGNVFAKITEEQKRNKCTWDVAAKRNVGKIVKEIFGQCFLVEADDDTKRRYEPFVEGGEKLPEWWRPPYQLFGSRLYPDIGLLIPKLEKRIALELDHSQSEKTALPGSKFKMALAKAAFSYLSHDWDYCYVLFYNSSGKSMKKNLNAVIEEKILQRYETELHTKILLFE